MKHALAVGGLVLLGCFTFSCSGKWADANKTDTNQNNQPQTPDDFVAAFARAYCGSLANCCASSSLAVDGSDCEQVVLAKASPDLGMPRTPSLTLVPAAAAECIHGWSSLWCSHSGGSHDRARDACSHVYRGTAALGASCSQDDDCQVGLSCNADAGAITGACGAAPAKLKLGADCSSDQAGCAAGSFCDMTALQCAPVKAQDEECSNDSECDSGFCSTTCAVLTPTPEICSGNYLPFN